MKYSQDSEFSKSRPRRLNKKGRGGQKLKDSLRNASHLMEDYENGDYDFEDVRTSEKFDGR